MSNNEARDHMLEVMEDFFGYDLAHFTNYTKEEIGEKLRVRGHTFAVLIWDDELQRYMLVVPTNQKKGKSWRQLAFEYYRTSKKTRDPFR